jgi:hypothetical protein
MSSSGFVIFANTTESAALSAAGNGGAVVDPPSVTSTTLTTPTETNASLLNLSNITFNDFNGTTRNSDLLFRDNAVPPGTNSAISSVFIMPTITANVYPNTSGTIQETDCVLIFPKVTRPVDASGSSGNTFSGLAVAAPIDSSSGGALQYNDAATLRIESNPPLAMVSGTLDGSARSWALAVDGGECSFASNIVHISSGTGIHMRSGASGSDLQIQNEDSSSTITMYIGATNVLQLASTGVSSSVKMTTYNGVATQGNGLAAIYEAVDLTAETASIGSTTLYAVPASGAGQYGASVSLICSTAGTAGTVTASIVNSNGSGSPTQTTSALSLTTLGNEVSTQFTMYSTSSVNITYHTTVAGATGSPKYNLHIRVEYLG